MIRIGPAGSGLGDEEGLREVKAKGLDALEFEFVYSVYLSNEQAKALGKLNKDLGLALSIHVPYYINLASEEKAKIAASKQRILSSCERGNHLGAKFIVFHPGFYGKRGPAETYAMVSTAIAEMQDIITKKGWEVTLAPETTGKGSQFGSLEELLRLRKERGCGLTVDFAHILARNGSIDYDKVVEQVKEIRPLHAHFSGINFGPKGERNHLLTPRDDAKKLLDALQKAKVDITIINESPDPVGDAVMMKSLLRA
ncbi:MAG: TIM barrel protein [Nanoarchaeota archaeon]